MNVFNLYSQWIECSSDRYIGYIRRSIILLLISIILAIAGLFLMILSCFVCLIQYYYPQVLFPTTAFPWYLLPIVFMSPCGIPRAICDIENAIHHLSHYSEIDVSLIHRT